MHATPLGLRLLNRAVDALFALDICLQFFVACVVAPRVRVVGCGSVRLGLGLGLG